MVGNGGISKGHREFARDGTYKFAVGDQTYGGTYRWIDDKTLETKQRDRAPQVCSVVVSQDELGITIGNETSKFLREKTAGATTGPAAIVTAAVVAKGVTPLSLSPIEVTDKFAVNQGVIHAVVTFSNAPGGTRVKAVWTAVNVGVVPPNTKAAESNDNLIERSKNIAFGFQSGNFPMGAYKVDIYVNGKLDRTLDFSVTKEATAGQAAKPVAIGSCRKPAYAEKPPGFPLGVTMAQGTGPQRVPVNPGRVFRPDSVFHAVVDHRNAPANTHVAARWFATDVGGGDPCNTESGSRFELVTAGSGNLDFTSTPRPGVKWPEGLYRVEIYVNGNLALATDFGVCEGSCKFVVPPSWKAQ